MPIEPPAPDEDDDFEYEVEPVDQEVIAHQQAHAQAELARARKAIDVDAIYRELDNRGDLDGAFEAFRARFTVKSLLIATTVVAVVLGIGGTGLLNGSVFAILICVTLLGLGTAHAWMNYQENLRREELIARRERELRQARRHSGEEDDEEEDEPLMAAASSISPLQTLTAFFRFSLMELFVAFTASAVMIALLAFAASPAKGAAAMGAMAIMGFAMQAAEVEIPRPLLLAFWVALLGYCVLTVVSIVL